ncbi:MAG: T9SS type B sorting domain-containing protein [Algibacter sp.]|uniref:T9SS type B sorting domain-containing protein n=1 Tax=Algibacter sp. TaxID=1872428 RepID=UPI002608B3FE|nr:T9SS type B sorting domain-containing protein [Algibacter sp.]MDG1729328.1 T9SS type B sorting domain-containing protein [Algibacter sp.]MDG2179047.1 T9SS type B sorting domain-containing protein [Algibacter sp.]
MCIILVILCTSQVKAQTPLFSAIPVSDEGVNNNIGNANTSRNVAIDSEGSIYVVYTGNKGIRVAKSVNRGQSFLPSVSVTTFNAEPEIIINDQDIVFIAWVESGNIMLSRSVDGGISYSMPVIVGAGLVSVHIAVFENHIYLVDKFGEFVYFNSNNGQGVFNATPSIKNIFTDIRVDQNGVVYLPSDNPIVSLYKSMDEGFSFSRVGLQPAILTLFSSYALSVGPCGTYIFIGGNGSLGYKIDVSNGFTSSINLGNNTFTNGGRTLFADHRGTLIDGYQNRFGELVMNISNDQGQTFGAPIVVATGGSHNIARNHITEDIVVAYEQNGAIYVSVYDNLLKSIYINAPIPLEVCIGKTLTIPYELSPGFSSSTQLSFYISDASGNFENKVLIASVMSNTSGNVDVVLPLDLLPGDKYRVQIESEADCTQSNSVPLIANPLPSVPFLSHNGPICEGENAVFSIIATPETEIFYTLNGTDANSAVTDATGSVSITLTNTITDLTLQLNQAIHLTTGCSSSLNISETVIVYPLEEVIFDFSSAIMCINTNGSEAIDSPPMLDTSLNNYEYSFNWYIDGVLQPQFQNLSSIMPSRGGTYQVEFTSLITNCTNVSQIFIVYESTPPVLEAQVVSDAFANNHIIEVKANNTASYNAISEYEFSLNNGNWVLGNGSRGGAYNFVFDQDVKLGVNLIKVRDVNGCGISEIEIIVMDYPHYFTPNGDGIHDTWNITAPKWPTNYLATSKIYVYDRYGKLLKQLYPNNAGWNGTYNGYKMPANDYWFEVFFVDPVDNNERRFRAHFTLKR